MASAIMLRSTSAYTAIRGCRKLFTHALLSRRLVAELCPSFVVIWGQGSCSAAQISCDECRSFVSRKLTRTTSWPEALSCWKMKNSAERWCTEISNCCDFLCKLEENSGKFIGGDHKSTTLDYSTFKSIGSKWCIALCDNHSLRKSLVQNLIKTDTVISHHSVRDKITSAIWGNRLSGL